MGNIQYNSVMRKIIFALVFLVAIVFVILRFSELKNILETLKRSDMRFLIVAVVIELIWLFNSATVYASLFRLVGLREKTPHLVLVATAANFVNVIAPSVGIGGMAVFLDDADASKPPDRARDRGGGAVYPFRLPGLFLRACTRLRRPDPAQQPERRRDHRRRHPAW